MRRTWIARALMMSGLIVGGAPLTAAAQPAAPVSEAAKQLARKNYHAGEAKFAAGDYAAALALYEQAEATIPVPQTKYKIAVCNDRLGRAAIATRWYQLFLDNVPPEKADKLAADMADARSRLAALRPPAPSGVRLAFAPPTAQVLVSIDGGAPRAATADVPLPPGHHHLVFQAAGYAPVVSDLDLSPGEQRDLRFSLQPQGGPRPPIAVVPAPIPGPVYGPAVVPPPTDYVPPPRRRSNVPGYVLLGAAGVGFIFEAAFGAAALNDKSNFKEHPTQAGADTESHHAVASDVSLGIAGALAITGIVYLVTNRAPAAQYGFVLPYVSPTSAGATAGVHF